MKKILLSLTVALLAAGATMAQEKGTTKIGAGLVYGSEAGMEDDGSAKGGIGINVGGEYYFTEKFSAAPSFTYFFKSEAEFFGSTISAQASSLNIDGRYYFGNSDNVSFYGLAGISVAFAKVEIDGDEGWIESGSESDSKAGVNLGAGLVYPINDKLDFNAQIKYNTPLEQLAVQLGIAFPIN